MCAHTARGCIPVHSRTFIQINMFSGVLPTRPNPKPVAERGANTFPGDAAEKKRKRARARTAWGGAYSQNHLRLVCASEVTLSRASRCSGRGSHSDAIVCTARW